ncbi:MAG: alpha/beta fold hydrolase [Thermoanaerobaculia bacterium]
MSHETFEVVAASGRSLPGIVDFAEEAGPRPVVVICHGFKGFQEWGFFPPLAELLAERGFTVVRFNLSGSGMKPGDELVTDPQAFHDNTYGRELEDLLAILQALQGGEIARGRVDLGRLGLFGHSRGGGASILAAASEAWLGRVRALVTWAAISHIDRVDAEQLAMWKRTGALPVANARTGQQLSLGPGLLAEMEAPPAHLDILGAASRLEAPWLIVHGEEDESVPAVEGRALAQEAQKEALFLPVAGGNHTFGSRHPFAGPTPQLIEAMNATQSWFLRYLRG